MKSAAPAVSCAVTVNVTEPCEKSTAEPDAGDTVAFSETVMVGTRAESRSETESELTLNVMLSPLMTGCDVTMLLASTEVSKVNETISASDDNSSAYLQENVPAMATVAASRRCFNDKLLRMSLFWFK